VGGPLFAIAVTLGVFALLLAARVAFDMLRATAAGVSLGPGALVKLYIWRVSPSRIIKPLSTLQNAGIHDVSWEQLATQALADGDTQAVASALALAKQEKIKLNFDTACAIDLAGRDVRAAVEESTKLHLLELPSPESGMPYIKAVAEDGIEVRMKATIHARLSIERLIGGVGAEVILARAGERMINTVGEQETHEAVINEPDILRSAVLGSGIDKGSAYRIDDVAFPILDRGEDIGAKLRAEHEHRTGRKLEE